MEKRRKSGKHMPNIAITSLDDQINVEPECPVQLAPIPEDNINNALPKKNLFWKKRLKLEKKQIKELNQHMYLVKDAVPKASTIKKQHTCPISGKFEWPIIAMVVNRACLILFPLITVGFCSYYIISGFGHILEID